MGSFGQRTGEIVHQGLTQNGKGGSQTTTNYQPQQITQANVPTFGQTGTGKSSSGQAYTYSPTSGQPTMGSPNQYTNTVGQWDNASIMPQPTRRSGKGKGG